MISPAHDIIANGDFQHIIESSLDGFLAVDLTGHIIETNDSYCLMTGYSRDELLRMHLTDIDPVMTATDVVNNLQQIRTSKSLRFETKHRRKCDGEIDVEVSAGYSSLHGGSCFSFIRNITGQKAAARQLAQSHDLMTYVIEHNRSGVAVLDREMKYLYVSQRFLDEHRVTRQDITGLCHYDLFPEIPGRWREMHRRVLAGEVIAAEEDPFVREDGAIDWTRWECRPWYEAGGAVGGIVLYTEVISERKNAELALRGSEERYRALVEVSPDAIVINLNNRITFVNAAAVRMFGATAAADLLGKSPFDFLHPDYHALVRERFASLMRGEPMPRVEEKFFRLDGSVMDLEAVSTLFETPEGTAIQIILRDITERKRLMESLAASEERFRLLFELHSDVMLLINPATGAILDANQAALAFYGYSRNELLAMSIYQINSLPQLELTDKLGHALNRENQNFVFKHRLADGSTRSVEVHSTPISFQKKEILFSIIRDITEQQRMEEELISSKERLRFALDAIDAGEWELNLTSFSAYHSPQYDRIFGYDEPLPAWTYGMFLDHVLPVDRDEVDRTHKEAIARKRGLDFECRIVRCDGEQRWIRACARLTCDIQGIPTRFVGIVEDITARKQAEAELVASRQFLQRLADNLPGLVAYWTPDLRCAFANEQYEQWYGMTPEQMMRTSVQDFMGEEIYTNSEKYIEGALRGEPQHFEREMVKANGERITAWVQYIPDIAQEKVQGVFVLASDITEVKRAQEENNKITAQLQQAQKMESIGRLAGGVAHDFNNKLMVILGCVELASLDRENPELLDGYLREITHAAQLSRDITMQLLAFSRQQVIMPEIINVNRVIDETRKTLGRLIGEDVAFSYQLDEDLWTIAIDPVQMDQIVMNLAVNARDAMPHGGEFTIETSNQTMTGPMCRAIGADTPGDYVRISFRDTGMGMDEETLPHIFEPFFTTKTVGKGTGLGLSIIHGIVHQNHGFIDVSSQVGQGTTFTICFPRHTMRPTETAAPGTSLVAGNGSILLVEDDDALRNVTALYMEKLGYAVHKASSPSEALIIARDTGVRVDLVFSDVMLPEMNGTELVRRIKEIRPGIKAIFASGYAPEHINLTDVLSTATFIMKPFDLTKLGANLQKALGTA